MKNSKVFLLMPIGIIVAILAIVFSFTQASDISQQNGLGSNSKSGQDVQSATTTANPTLPHAVPEVKPVPPEASAVPEVKPVAESPVPVPPPISPVSKYVIHRNVTATVFWVGEPQGNGSSEDNAFSAWDDAWMEHYGGYDDPESRSGFFPSEFIPKENPFYLDVPYNDFDDNGTRKSNAFSVVPWASEKKWSDNESLMKNRWVKLIKGSLVCYGQIEDAGPYEYDDINYVFGTAKPINKLANSAGLDVSPALRDCLKFSGSNNADNKVDWQFIDAKDVPKGPWTEIITTSQIYWP